MAVARFYHLTRDPPEALLPALIGKALEQGLRVAVRGRDLARLEALDLALWRAEGFLPHGLCGGPHDADQPVLLCHEETPAPELPNSPRCLITLEATSVGKDEAEALERLCIVFDGTDEAAVTAARVQWRELTAAGVAAEYWNRESGRWTCQSRHPAA
ncbi:DNA polymerase III subunit chi [Pararhodobacter sp. SW119]|uniref:DNA polymerase III subunit chi n=1 Tax=Pararhodobacter sp. SW119 TaxID=2780075 RepID=UPI001AE06EFD|nr:DNA polymerase III subunit chi [Pararhodobacter sp. SW119]